MPISIRETVKLGHYPDSRGLIRDASGNLYGTNNDGGDAKCFCGTVFEISRDGKETVLYTFTGGQADGQNPVEDLVRDADGNLYGITDPTGGTAPLMGRCLSSTGRARKACCTASLRVLTAHFLAELEIDQATFMGLPLGVAIVPDAVEKAAARCLSWILPVT
jgi:hypothetical protein